MFFYFLFVQFHKISYDYAPFYLPDNNDINLWQYYANKMNQFKLEIAI